MKVILGNSRTLLSVLTLALPLVFFTSTPYAAEDTMCGIKSAQQKAAGIKCCLTCHCDAVVKGLRYDATSSSHTSCQKICAIQGGTDAKGDRSYKWCK